MAKRYHHEKKDGMHHKDKMMMHNEREGYYEGPSSRLHQESVDGSMIREDRAAVANLPQGVMIKPYPMNRGYMPDGLDDTIRGIDSQIDMDDRKREEDFSPHKY
jgi:hypothetical protein